MMKTDFIYLTWTDLYQDAKDLAAAIKKENNWDQIIAVSRGGLFPAAVIAKEIGVMHVDTVCISSYRNYEKKEMRIIKRIDNDSDNILVIDDLVDTGETAEVIREMLPNAYYAVLYAKPGGLPLVDSYLKPVSPDTWIVFPWEEGSSKIS
jgi:xanthine phosphoribosyltransferase